MAALRKDENLYRVTGGWAAEYHDGRTWKSLGVFTSRSAALNMLIGSRQAGWSKPKSCCSACRAGRRCSGGCK